MSMSSATAASPKAHPAPDFRHHPLQLLAFGFGSGLSPKAPGTVGTVVAIPLYFLIDHGGDEGAPADGWPRMAWTAAANLAMAVGFSLLLCAGYQLRAPSGWLAGLGWGAAGYAVFFAAPGLGLSPELPGTAAAELGLRQDWWLATALATAVGLALVVWARQWWLKLLGVVVAVIPHLLGAPHPETAFSLAPETLEQRFITVTFVVNAVFWLVLGAVSAGLFARGAGARVPDIV